MRLPDWATGVRARAAAPIAALAAVCYLPLLATHRGMVGADTKSYLYLDPDRLLGRAWSMWDPNVGLGTVPHQNIGYLWPMGPYYWAFERLGVPDWIAQRLWLGSILFLAGLGVRYLLRSLGRDGPGVAAAMFVYALTPYVLTLGARISALLLPFTALGWLVGLVVRACRERSWVHPALFALAVPTFGSTNATALLLVGLGPALWIVHVVVRREVTVARAGAVVARIGVLTLATSAWWIVGLWCQGAFGIDVLRYTETARTVADASSAPELLRGLGYWYFYGGDKLGPWIEPSTAYTQNPLLLTVNYALPVLGLLAAGTVRWAHRGYAVTLVAVGTFVAVGAHPWGEGPPLGRGFQVFLDSQAGLAMRSLPRAVPLIALGLALSLAVAIDALAALERPAWWRPPPIVASLAVCALAVLGLPPLWQGQMVADNLQRDEDLPAHWLEAAEEIDARGQVDGIWVSRVLEVPGSDFASYRWGNTVDPITPGITDRPFVARELIPYGTPASADLLNSFDRQVQEEVLDPDAIGPLARLMGVGDIVLRGDLEYERFNVVRPRQLYALLTSADGLGDPAGFGEGPNVPDPRFPLEDETELGADPDLPDPAPVVLLEVAGDPTITTAKPTSRTVLLAGSADGIIAAAAAGLIDGTELIRYSGSASATGGEGADELRDAVADGGVLVVTDTNRRSARRWGSVRETDGMTEPADHEPTEDPSDNRLPLFDGAGTDAQTVAVWRGGVSVDATSYGNDITYTPEDRPARALDDDLRTSWSAAAFDDARGERIDIAYEEPVTPGRVRVVQASQGVQNRWITEVRIRFDDDEHIDVELDPASRGNDGQWIDVGDRTFEEMSIEVLATDAGVRDVYDGLSSIGFADIRLEHGDRRLEESIRPPTDLLDALGAESEDLPLALVLTRRRTRPTAPLRSDEELTIVRDLRLPTARDLSLTGEARLSPTAPDALIDLLIGLAPSTEGGLDATSSRRLPGDLTARASAAVDGDPSTHWSPGFLGQEGEWTAYTLADEVSFDRMDLTVVADGRHSVPTRLRIIADGETAAVVDVPAVEDRSEPDATVDVPVTLPNEVTGTRIEVHVEATRDVTTNDWLSESPIVMPVGITEWGIPGVTTTAREETFDSGCRDDLVEVDGEAVPVRVTGSTVDAIAGNPLEVETCDGGPVGLPAGDSLLRTGDGRDIGIDIDALTLRSAAGGGPDPVSGPLAPTAPDVEVTIVDQGRWRSTVEVAPRDEPTWLVVGQSHSEGWRATADGVDLGDPVLVDGFSSAFLLPPGDEPVVVEVEWRPQRVVFGGLAVSAVAAVGVAALAAAGLWRRRSSGRRAKTAGGPSETATGGSSLDAGWTARPPLPWPAAGVVAAIGALAGILTVNPVGAVVLAAAGLAASRTAKGRLLVAFGPAAALAVSGAYIVLQQVRHALPAGFDWPTRFSRVHGVAAAGVWLLVLGAVVDAVAARRDHPDA